jgi:hypothetical protein
MPFSAGAMIIIRLFSCLALLGIAGTALANSPGQGPTRLFQASEWERVCADRGPPQTVAYCKARVHLGVAGGRSLPPFELVSPADPSLLQSRSGVFFRNHLNDRIVRVSEDNGLRTTLMLEDDVRCQAYAAAPDLVGVPSIDHSYDRLIRSWLNVYTDENSRIRTVRVMRQYGRQTLQFDAVTANNRLIRGVYLVDAQANAAIFSTCDQPVASAGAHRNSELFFGSIVGSARKFI